MSESMDSENKLQWLEWAKELQFIAQAGLTYSKDPFDLERFARIREISAEMMSRQSGMPIKDIHNLFCNETGFQTPKLDTRAAIFPGWKNPSCQRKGRQMANARRMGRRNAEHKIKYN